MAVSAWARARELADLTPETRNRYVDFLRAASIAVVVIGHWLAAAPVVDGGELTLSDMLHTAPWTQWLTWIFQVMPVFFIVGGYSNAASWEAARGSGQSYAAWADTRLRRLIGPVVPLLIVWTLLALGARWLGVSPGLVRVASQVAFIPTWFLAVYVLVVVAAPATHWAWRRFGLASFWGFALGAVIVDAVAFIGDLPQLRWANYAFVWLGVHQLGYLWRAGGFGEPGRALLWAAGGLALLVALVVGASYPVSMITVPGEEVSNSRPPTLALLALGVFQGGLLLALERPARHWLRGARLWTATVLVNASIMSLYLWHMTALVVLIGLMNLAGGFGLGLEPGTSSWWLSRPLWIATLALVLAPLLMIFTRFERGRDRPGSAPAAWRPVAGALMMCAGLALLALGGIGADAAPGVRVGVVALAFAGVLLIRGLPARGAAAP